MGSKTKTQERRKFKRIDFRAKIQYKDFYNPLKLYRSATCLSIGMGGASFVGFEPIALESVLTLLADIPVPYSYQNVQAKIFAKVIHIKKQDNKSFFIGVHFIAIDRKGAIAIGQWVDRALQADAKHSLPAHKKLEKAAAGF